METIYKGIDDLNGKSYELRRCNAKELSQTLKDNYMDMGKDYSIYDTITKEDGEDIKEIYEYLNFSLLELNDGKLILLDGFRRLLSYDAPDMDITVRVYKYSDFTRAEILLLLVNYNQFKLIGTSGGNYFERGFFFLFDVLFNIKLMDFIQAMRGYLEKELGEDKYYFSRGGNSSNKIKNIPSRIVNEEFLDDMVFLRDIDVPFKNSAFFGSLVYDLREKGYRDKYDVSNIESLIKDNSGVLKQKKIIDTYGMNDYRGQKAFEEIGEVYKAIFNELNGVKREMTYAEKVIICDYATNELKNDKDYFKISSKRNYREISNYIKGVGLDKVRFQAVVYPTPNTKYRTYGLVTDMFGKFMPSKNNYHTIELLEVFLKDKGKEVKLSGSGYNTYGGGTTKRWCEVRLRDNEELSEFGLDCTSKIEVFISIDGLKRKDIEKALKK